MSNDLIERLRVHAERSDSPIAHEAAGALAAQAANIADRDGDLERAEEQYVKLTERCAALKGQVEAGAAEIERPAS